MSIFFKKKRKAHSQKRIVIIGTQRYNINANDFYMFFRRTQYSVVGVLMHRDVKVKDWWISQAKEDAARLNCYEPFDLSLVKFWKNEKELKKQIDRLDTDYICVGNGSDAVGAFLKDTYAKDKLLFSEYGWLPWNQHFYISKGGAAIESDIFGMSRHEIHEQKARMSEIEKIKNHFLLEGRDVPYSDFIYVPLQVDENDFKFTLTDFENNKAFLNFVCEIAPRDTKILVKNHPLNKKPTDLTPYQDRVIDISKEEYSRGQLYEKMAAMVCINSTSILEAIAFEKRIFVYGTDIYQDKGLVYQNVKNTQEFAQKLIAPVEKNMGSKFISLLLQRQISRLRCLENDTEYIDNHYWANNL